MQLNNGKLRIAIEAQRIFRPRKHGMDIVTLEMIKNLQIIDQVNEYFILTRKDIDICLSETPNFKIVYLNSVSYPDWEQVKLYNWIKENKPDIVHCTSNTAPIFGKYRLFLTLHDVIFLEKNYLLSKNGGSPYQRFGNLYRKLIVPKVARKAEQLFTVSNFQKEKINEVLHISKNNIEVLNNGVSNIFFHSVDTDQKTLIRKQYHLPEKYLFFLGNTEPRKNLDGVIKAYLLLYNEIGDDLPNLVIKGITREYLVKKLQEISATDLLVKIRLITYIDQKHFHAIYQMAEMLLFPSFSEGFGIPIIEAMASGIPVITSNLTSMPEVAGDAALLIDPGSAKELASSIKQLLFDTKLKDTLITKGLERARLFTWDKLAMSVYKKYTSVNQSSSQQK